MDSARSLAASMAAANSLDTPSDDDDDDSDDDGDVTLLSIRRRPLLSVLRTVPTTAARLAVVSDPLPARSSVPPLDCSTEGGGGGRLSRAGGGRSRSSTGGGGGKKSRQSPPFISRSQPVTSSPGETMTSLCAEGAR